jgi:glycosyltransferase involved in cell wall biosynthesis
MPILLSAADVCLAHSRKLSVFEGMLPIKMYEAMACGRPLLLALNGEACEIAVREAGAALHVEPENAEALASAVLYLRDHPAKAQHLAMQGRRYIQGRYDYDTLTKAFDKYLTELLKSDSSQYCGP